MRDKDTLRVGRIDLVDDHGVTRVTLAADGPDPMVDGVRQERVAPFAGILIHDEEGTEMGGLGYLGGPEGRAVWALDHAAYDAVGTSVAPDGTVTLAVNQSPQPEAAVDVVEGATRFRVTVAADGTPEIVLADAQDRPRLRLTLRGDGAGAIEFLDASGDVVSAIVPEHRPDSPE